MFTIIGADGKEYGPVTADTIREWLAQQRLTLAMMARRVGEAEWRRLADFPEFAAPAGEGAVTPPALVPERIAFTGDWVEYFKIWIVNVLLTVVTLGIYAAWAKVRKRRYFYANTRVFGHAFEYLADPLKIFYGNLIVVGAFVIFSVLNAINPLVSLPWVFAFLLAVPWFIVRALAFNARNSAWRGLRFNFTGRYGESAGAFLGLPVLTTITLGLLLPFAAKKQKDFVVGRHGYGTTQFRFAGEVADFYKIYGKSLVFFLPAFVFYFMMIVLFYVPATGDGGSAAWPLGAVALFALAGASAMAGTFYFRSRMFNYVWTRTSLAGNRFVASLRARDLFLVHLTNSIVTLVTIGLLHPWAQVRMAKLKLESIAIVPAGNIDAFVAAAQPPVGAIGEAASDFFDFDFGFGL